MSAHTAEPPGYAAAPATAPYRAPWLLRLPFPVRNMLRRWRGMLGMMVGVGISLGIVMTILAISQASLDLYTLDYRRSGADLYVITQGGTLVPILPGEGPGTLKTARHTLAQVRGMPGVRTAVGAMNWSLARERPGPKRRDEPVELVAVLGIDGDPAEIPGVLLLDSGRWLRRADEIVVGDKLQREKGLQLGETLRLSGRDFRIVGVGRLRGFGFSTNALTYMDYRAFRARADLGDVFNMLVIDADDASAVRERVLELGSLAALTPADLVAQAELSNKSAVIFRWLLSALSLAVAALFVSNMLGRSVAERRLEFGTLRAIGIPGHTILAIVALEALLVSFIAGLFGMGLSLLMGWGINATLAKQYGFESLYAADAGLFGVVLALALLLGLIAGLFPARNATRVDPVTVLREA